MPSAEKVARPVGKIDPAGSLEGVKVTIHRGPIPGTNIGRHWFDAADGNRYGIQGGPGPDGGNRGWAYEVVDAEGRGVDDSMFTLAEIREWATWTSDIPPAKGYPDMPCEDCEQGLSTCCVPPGANE